MRRRDFIALLGVAAALLLTARAGMSRMKGVEYAYSVPGYGHSWAHLPSTGSNAWPGVSEYVSSRPIGPGEVVK